MTKKKEQEEPEEENIHVFRHKIGKIELNKWLKRFGENEIPNYVIKIGWKDKETDEWHNPTVRFNEGDLMTMKRIIDYTVNWETEKLIERNRVK